MLVWFLVKIKNQVVRKTDSMQLKVKMLFYLSKVQRHGRPL